MLFYDESDQKKGAFRKTILILVNNLGFFVTHRLPIARAAREKGYSVCVGYGELGNASLDILAQFNIGTCFVPQQRGGINPLRELRSLFFVWRCFLQVRPDLVHLITIKPYLYGGLFAHLTGVKAVVSAVPGLGGLFIRSDWRSRLIRSFLFPLYRIAFSHPNQRVIVQNPHDLEVLVNWGVLDPRKTRLLKGSGVDLSKFSRFVEPEGIHTICFAARLLRDKGLYDLLSAARILRARGVNARFWVAGEPDPRNSTGLSEQEVLKISEEGILELLGYQKDIPALYADSHIICFPSFYGEGIPKTLIEAAAAGRPIVTTDHPGCRDTVISGVSGLLVPIKSPEKLADALQWLIEHPKERVEMGKAGRRFAEHEFAQEQVIDTHLAIYQEVLNQDL
jgi:glycosyltransferase involved in cell wall biosynthesis